MGKIKEKTKKFYDDWKGLIWYSVGFSIACGIAIVTDKIAANNLEKKYEAFAASGEPMTAVCGALDGHNTVAIAVEDRVTGKVDLYTGTVEAARQIGENIIKVCDGELNYYPDEKFLS